MLGLTLHVALALLPTTLAAAAPRQVAQGQTERQIESVSQPGQCLYTDLNSGTAKPGSGVQVLDCPETIASIWTVGPGANPSVRFTGSNLCLDAGSTYKSSGVGKLSMQTCDTSAPSQKWYYTGDNHLSITGGTQCLDSAAREFSNLNTTQCGSTNTQGWKLTVPNSPAGPFQIHPNGDKNTCLVASSLKYGASVKHGPCNQGVMSSWFITNGTNKNGISPAGAGGLCLNAAESDTNNALVTMDSCEYVNLFPHKLLWYYTADNHIAIQGGGQCLDAAPKRTDGAVQTYACSGGNTDQVWTTSVTNFPSFDYPSSTPPAVGVQLHANGSTEKCLAVRGNGFGVGSTLALVECFQPGESALFLQTFSFKRNQPTNITMTGTNSYGQQTLCVDFGPNPANGATPKLNVCFGVAQQTFWVTNDNRVAVYNGDQCLDVVKGSQPTDERPYGTLGDVQSWKCTPGDTQQIFT